MKRVNTGMSSEIEQVVTNLLRTTKALLEALTQWSLQRASNSNIFEIHDTLEKQFFLVSQAFEEANVSMNDLQWIPGQLRESVSTAMMEAPSPASLDQYLPRIREVIVQLLHGLKGKQASLRERERESRIRASESWNREVPLAALNRGSSGSRMMYPPSSSPPLPPVASPRMNPHNGEYDPWGGMPRPAMPTNDLSSRIMSPRNGSISSTSRPYSPPPRNHSNQGSPSLHATIVPSSPSMPLPTRSTSSNLSKKSPTLGYTAPAPPPPPPPPQPPVYPPEDVDESDPNTAIALAALKRQENLARRSSVRRASMFRGNGDNLGATNGAKQRYYDNPPPVPTLPGQFNAKETKMETVAETQDNNNNGLTLFLQVGKQVKKIQYQGEVSLPALNMLFLENFSYSSRQSDFPQIYIRDPAVGVSYELIDLAEVKDKAVISLNINEEEEQKESQKEWLAEISKVINKELSETKQSFTEQMEQLKEQMKESAKAMDEAFKSTPQSVVTVSEATVTTSKDASANSKFVSKDKIDVQMNEIQTLRRDIAVLRQLDREMKEGTAHVIQEIKDKAAAVMKQAPSAAESGSNTSAARHQLEEGKTTLLEKSEKVTTRLEDLQDTIDQLKLDVTQRKCRPSQTQMTHCGDERKALAKEIEEFGQFIAQVKPKWKKTWEQELQMIVKEQQTLKDQEYLLSDMKDDLDALCEVFDQLEKIYAYQVKTKPVMREFRVAPPDEGYEGMNSVFKQVESIDVDHDRRLRAMEQADKMRQREMANRIDDFEHELSTFVDAKKLKKTGGALEIDRLRKQKEEELLKSMYNNQKNKTNNNPTPADEE